MFDEESETELACSNTSILCHPCLSRISALNQKHLQYPDDLNVASQLCDGRVPDSELPGLHAFLNKADRDLMIYDKAITELQTSLECLKKGRQDLAGRRATAAGHLSPIRRLPVEILTEIFTVVCCDDSTYAADCPAEFPVTRISTVCPLWHRLIMSRPTLWAYLHIHRPHFPGSRYRDLSRFHELFARSKDVHLKLRFIGGPYPLHEDERGVLSILLDHAARWQEAEFNVSGVYLQEWLLFAASKLEPSATDRDGGRQKQVHFPHLECLRLLFNVSLETPSQDIYGRIFGICPRLRVYRTSSLESSSSADFRTITELDVQTFKGPSLAHLLSRFPALQSLHLSSFTESECYNSNVIVPSRYSSGISRLAIEGAYTIRSRAFYSLRLPLLTVLELSNSGFPPRCLDVDALSSVLSQSQCKLQELRFQLVSLDHIIQLTTHNPSVCRLSIHNVFEGDSFQRLAEHLSFSDGRMVLPNLRALKLAVYSSQLVSEDGTSREEVIEEIERIIFLRDGLQLGVTRLRSFHFRIDYYEQHISGLYQALQGRLTSEWDCQMSGDGVLIFPIS